MPTPKVTARDRRLLPGGVPRWLRCYDNSGSTADRYTVVFTGRYTHKTGGEHWVVGSSADPWWPQGAYLHAAYREIVDRPRSAHLGRRIRWEDLPEAVRDAVLLDYIDLWGLVPGDVPPSRQEARRFAARVRRAGRGATSLHAGRGVRAGGPA